jgi:hypothetical protein
MHGFDPEEFHTFEFLRILQRGVPMNNAIRIGCLHSREVVDIFRAPDTLRDKFLPGAFLRWGDMEDDFTHASTLSARACAAASV